MLIYLMNFIDRANITAARLQGLQDDLHISGFLDVQYDTVLAILYVTYCLSQVPSNLTYKIISRPSLYIGCCVVFWGLSSTLTGITTSYTGILICRLFIGMPEAAFYPGAVYLLSRWYIKKVHPLIIDIQELAFRSAILYSGLLIANAFGNLIAAGILSRMEGVRNIRAWRWQVKYVFMIAWWLLPDHVSQIVINCFYRRDLQPDNTYWLSAKERELAQIRMAEDTGEADKDHSKEHALEGLKMALKDPLVYIFAIQTTFGLIGLSFSSFFPTLTKTLGFSTTTSLLLAAPPWLFAAILCCLNAWHADRTGERFFHIAGWFWVIIVGSVIGISSMSVPARYVSFFFMTCGNAGSALNLVWVSNAIPRPPIKRAAAIGFVSSAAALGSLTGSYVWKSEWGPSYRPSMMILIGALVISTSLQFVIRNMLIRKNARLTAEGDAFEADRIRVEEAAKLQGITFEDALERRKRFQYLY
ncbi:hypothetical protein J132_03064 [Termitomyces sp. J132]|nr:hypothetical protein J132_03064 [Termitomyces sp. J132]